MTKRNEDPRHQGRSHYYRAAFAQGGLIPVRSVCVHCGCMEGVGNHVPIRVEWKEAMQALAVMVIGKDIPNLRFRPVDVTRLTRTNQTPLEGRNVVRGLQRAGLVEPMSQAGLPRGRAASWWTVTPEGWVWLRTPSRRQPRAVREAHAGGSVPL